MTRVHIVGRRNHGKTTLVVDLVKEFSRRGLKVGTIKHSSHEHEWDTPGKDSHRHGEAGATPAAVVGPNSSAVFLRGISTENLEAALNFLYVDCDIVLIEGHIDGTGPKVEVWRKEPGTALIAGSDGVKIQAVVSDDEVPLSDEEHRGVPVWPRKDIEALASRILTLARSAKSVGVQMSGEPDGSLEARA